MKSQITILNTIIKILNSILFNIIFSSCYPVIAYCLDKNVVYIMFSKNIIREYSIDKELKEFLTGIK